MALIGAAAILVANGGANRPRGPNIHRRIRFGVGVKLRCKTGFTPKFNTKPNSTIGLKPVLDAGIKVRCKT